jgi:hypothetical protein
MGSMAAIPTSTIAARASRATTTTMVTTTMVTMGMGAGGARAITGGSAHTRALQ